MGPRIDCHVHLDSIRGNARPSGQPGPTIEQFSTYVNRHGLSLVWGIFENDETVHTFSRVCPILPLFWIRDPLSIGKISPLAKGIKLHPYRDGWEISLGLLALLLSKLGTNAIVLIHCDDRSRETIEATRPGLIEPLAANFPELVFVVGHSGSYAPNPAVQTKAVPVAEEITRRLTEEAIGLALRHDNVYLDTSVLVSRVKAEILAQKAPHHKLLIGTDFPLGAYRDVPNYDREEQTIGSLGVSVELVRSNALALSQRAGIGLPSL